MYRLEKKDQGCKMINGVEKQYPNANQSVIQKLNMSLKNSNVIIKIPKLLQNKLNNKRVNKIYKTFEKSLKINENFIVAVSGGPDSLALAFLSKIYSIKNNLKSLFVIVDHKIRNESTIEAKKCKKFLKNLILIQKF